MKNTTAVDDQKHWLRRLCAVTTKPQKIQDALVHLMPTSDQWYHLVQDNPEANKKLCIHIFQASDRLNPRSPRTLKENMPWALGAQYILEHMPDECWDKLPLPVTFAQAAWYIWSAASSQRKTAVPPLPLIRLTSTIIETQTQSIPDNIPIRGGLLHAVFNIGLPRVCPQEVSPSNRSLEEYRATLIHNLWVKAYPDIDWPPFSERAVCSALGVSMTEWQCSHWQNHANQCVPPEPMDLSPC